MAPQQLEGAIFFARGDEREGAQIGEALPDRHFLQHALRIFPGPMLVGNRVGGGVDLA